MSEEARDLVYDSMKAVIFATAELNGPKLKASAVHVAGVDMAIVDGAMHGVVAYAQSVMTDEMDPAEFTTAIIKGLQDLLIAETMHIGETAGNA